MDNKNTVISTKQSARERRMIRFLELYSRYGVFAILALIVIVFTILSGIFLTLENILAIFQQASFTIVVACGMTMLLISGCTDLSAGALVAFCGMLASVMIQNGQPEVLAIFAALIAGIIGSTINGVLIGYFGLLPFMTTLSTQLIFRGLTYIINNGVPVPGFGTLVNLSRQTFLGISYLVWIALILVAVTYVILQLSNYGRRVYAV